MPDEFLGALLDGGERRIPEHDPQSPVVKSTVACCESLRLRDDAFPARRVLDGLVAEERPNLDADSPPRGVVGEVRRLASHKDAIVGHAQFVEKPVDLSDLYGLLAAEPLRGVRNNLLERVSCWLSQSKALHCLYLTRHKRRSAGRPC